LKFRDGRSNRYLNIVSFQFSRLLLSAILDFKQFEILTAVRVQCVKVRNPGEFRGFGPSCILRWSCVDRRYS